MGSGLRKLTIRTRIPDPVHPVSSRLCSPMDLTVRRGVGVSEGVPWRRSSGRSPGVSSRVR